MDQSIHNSGENTYADVAACFGQFQCDNCPIWFPVNGTDYETAVQTAMLTGWKVTLKDRNNDPFNAYWDILCPECAEKNFGKI